jgi:hypothetical protein
MKLKDLLRGSDREQVQFNLEAPPITPGQQFQAGQYRVAVGEVPSASQTTAGKLAQALGSINPAIQAYSEFQQAQTDLQKTVIARNIEEMTLDEQKKYAALIATQDKINTRFRNEEYELNPNARIFAKEFIGSKLAPEYRKFVETESQDYINRRVKELGEMPSEGELQDVQAQLLAQFREKHQQAFADPLINSGFMRSTAEVRDLYSAKLAKQAAEQHKNEMMIPAAADALVASVDNINELSPEQLQLNIHEAWHRASLFGAQDQNTIIAYAINSFPLSEEGIEEAEQFVHALVNSGIEVGNQTLYAEKGDGNIVANDIYQLLNDKKANVARDRQIKHKEISDKYFNNGLNRALDDSVSTTDYYEELDASENTIIEDATIDNTERAAKLDGITRLRAARVNRRSIQEKIIRNYITDEATDRSVLTNGVQTALAGAVQARLDIAGEDISPEEKELLSKLIDIQPVKGEGGVGIVYVAKENNITPEGLSLLQKPANDFARAEAKIVDLVSGAKPGQAIEYEGQTYTIDSTDVAASKGRAATGMLLAARDRILAEAQTDITNAIQRDLNAYQDEQVRVEKIQEAKQAIASRPQDQKAALELLSLDVTSFPFGGTAGIGTAAITPSGDTSIMRFKGPAAPSRNFGWAFGKLTGEAQRFFRFKARDAENLEEFTDAFDQNLRVGSFKGNTPVAMDLFMKHVKEAIPAVEAELRYFQAPGGYLTNIAGNRQIAKDVSRALIKAKHLVGYDNPNKVVDSINSGSVGIAALDLTDEERPEYYENGLLGLSNDNIATIKVNYDKKEDLAPIAKRLGINIDDLHNAQQRRLQLEKGRVPRATIFEEQKAQKVTPQVDYGTVEQAGPPAPGVENPAIPVPPTVAKPRPQPDQLELPLEEDTGDLPTLKTAKYQPMTRAEIPDFRKSIDEDGVIYGSLDFNSFSDPKVKGIEVVVPEDAPKEHQEAVKKFAIKAKAFFKQYGKVDVPLRGDNKDGIRLRTDERRGVKGVFHIEPFFAADEKSRKAIEMQPRTWAKLLVDSFGPIGMTFILPHGVGEDKGALLPDGKTTELEWAKKHVMPYIQEILDKK